MELELVVLDNQLYSHDILKNLSLYDHSILF